MRKLTIIVFLLISLPILLCQTTYSANLFNAQGKYYQDFEDEPLGDFDDGDRGGGLDFAEQYTDCFSKVESSYTARYGSKYLNLGCQWPGDNQPEWTFRRAYAYFEGDDLHRGNRLNYNDGTEYWLGWSQWVPPDYGRQTYGHGLFQAFGARWSGGTCTSNSWTHVLFSFGGSNGQNPGEIKYTSRMGSGTIDSVPWDHYKGTWIDWVLHMRLYDSSNTNARFRIYKNGTLWAGDTNDGDANLEEADCTVTLNFMDYNWWGNDCGEVIDCGNCKPAFQPALACTDDTWTRNNFIDEIRLFRYASGDAGNHYAAVAPPIPPGQPTNISPANAAIGVSIDTALTADTYRDSRTDGQNAFNHYKTQWQIAEDISPGDNDCTTGVNWANPKFDLVSDSAVTCRSTWPANLDKSTRYCWRVRYASWAADIDRDGDGITAASDSDDWYWGDWSTATYFTTGSTGGGGETCEMVGGLPPPTRLRASTSKP